jgi:pantothenate kinase
MSDIAATLARIRAAISSKDDGHSRLLIALAGPPGAGKSTIADALADAINSESSIPAASVIPMDGYHFDNAILDARGLRARKGAPETFDASGFLAMIRRLRSEHSEIAIPVFDRAEDLSRGSARIITPDQRLLIVEGNYLLLDRPIWRDLQPLFDVSIVLRPAMETIEQRLIQRWVHYGLDLNAARAKARDNDLVNAATILAESRVADITLQD